MDILEIIVSVFCAFGIYAALDTVKEWIMYPPGKRKNIRAAVIFDSQLSDGEIDYAKYLYKQQKISSGRLIILTENGIIENKDELSQYCDIVYCTNIEEVIKNAEGTD